MICFRTCLTAGRIFLPLAVAGPALAADAAAQKFSDVLAVTVYERSKQRFDFDVTVSSPYDSPQRYADAFRVTGKNGSVFGERSWCTTMLASSPSLGTFMVSAFRRMYARW